MERTPFFEIVKMGWDSTLDMNLHGYFLVGQAVARAMANREEQSDCQRLLSEPAYGSTNLTHFGAAKGGISTRASR